jgi:hypothetical protein
LNGQKVKCFGMYMTATSKSIKKEYPDKVIWENEQGEYHREDGPAIECNNGDKFWYINGKLHRDDGPAIKLNNARKTWCINGKIHRLNGPAAIWASGWKEWFIGGYFVYVY